MDIDVVRRLFDNFNEAYNSLTEIKEVCIIISNEDQKNENPIHVDNGYLGIEKWCVKHLYLYVYKQLMEFLSKDLTPDHPDINTLSRCVVILCSDCTTAWNIRKQLLEFTTKENTLKDELHLTKLAIMRHPKSTESFAQRRWILKKLFNPEVTWTPLQCLPISHCKNCGKPILVCSELVKTEEISDMHLQFIETELKTCSCAADRHTSNYGAWSHRSWVVNTLVLPNFLKTRSEQCANILVSELATVMQWIELNVSDHSGMSYCKEVLSVLTVISLFGDEQVCKCNNKNTHTQGFSAFFKCKNIQNKWYEVVKSCNDLLLLHDGCHEALWMFKYELVISYHKLIRSCVESYVTHKVDRMLSCIGCQEFCDLLKENKSTPSALYCSKHHMNLISKFFNNLL